MSNWIIIRYNVKGINYIYYSDLFWSYKFVDNVRNDNKQRYGRKYMNRDKVSVLLDLKQRIIRFFINDENQGIAYENIQIGNNIRYRMFVSLFFADNSVSILGFSQH